MNVAPALEPHLRPIEDLILLPGNPRQGDIGAISASLERFGQLKPIVVDSDGVILAGNHTYQAAVALGWSQIAAVTTELAGSEAAGFALADNRLSDLATYDNEALLAMLAEAGDLDGTGYDFDDLDALRYLIDSPVDLDALHSQVGDMTPDDFRPRLVLILDPETMSAWTAHRKGYETDDEALSALL